MAATLDRSFTVVENLQKSLILNQKVNIGLSKKSGVLAVLATFYRLAILATFLISGRLCYFFGSIGHFQIVFQAL